MRIYNKYIFALVLAAGLVNVILAFTGQEDLFVYFIFNLMAYLVITLLFTYFSPPARRALNAVSAAAFAGFLVVVVLKVIEILGVR